MIKVRASYIKYFVVVVADNWSAELVGQWWNDEKSSVRLEHLSRWSHNNKCNTGNSTITITVTVTITTTNNNEQQRQQHQQQMSVDNNKQVGVPNNESKRSLLFQSHNGMQAIVCIEWPIVVLILDVCVCLLVLHHSVGEFN